MMMTGVCDSGSGNCAISVTKCGREGHRSRTSTLVAHDMESLLFIEDDDGIRLALSLALEDEGYSVREAANGADGLASFDHRAPDLVLLDLRLPDMSGFDVCRAIRAESIVPIIMITAQTDTHDMVAGLEAGADDYVTKPVVPKELAARIRASLRRMAPPGQGHHTARSAFRRHRGPARAGHRATRTASRST